jgi:hypothetical protein
MSETLPQRLECAHVKAGAVATVTIAMRAIPGAPTRAVDLDTETRCCTLCAARMVAALRLLETNG